MKRVYTLLLTVLISGGWAFSQTPTSWTDNFDDNDLDTVAWKSLPGIYELAEANGELTITATKEDAWDGFFLKFPDKIDLSEHPYASLRIKADSSFDFRIYLWDENAEDTLYNKANADVWVVPGETYNTYYFNWSGKFMHSDVEGEFLYQDSTDIDGFLIDVDPGNSDLLYQGTIVFDDVIVGEGAEQPTANAEITSSAIGSVGATVVSDIPEGTVVSDLLGGLTANGGITMFAAGSPGKGGVEATGTDLLVSSMDIVVLLDGSNPKKYDVLVAPPSLPCYYRADFPTVDGEIDNVWETVPLVEMPYYYHDEVPEGPTDLAAAFRTLWDEVSIFFLVEVTDDVKKIDSPANLPYQDDCVEFWFDLNNSKNSSYLPSETDEYQVMFVRDNTNSHSVNHNDLIEGMDWAWKDTQGGYIFELEIPWLTSFKWMERYATTQPEFNQKLGFEVHVNDDDDADPDRDLNVGWFNSIDEAWNDPSVLGDLKMMEEIYESVESLSSSMKFRIQPNPASDNLQLISTTGINSVEVINMIGQSVMNIQPRGERLVNLNIAELPGNIYLVKVKDQTGNVSTKKFVKK
jgi:hypothetical protein